jgi:hypothetical protein
MLRNRFSTSFSVAPVGGHLTLGKKLKTTNVNQSEFDDITRSFVGLELSRPWRGHGTALFSEVGPLLHTYERTKRPRAERGLEFSWSWRVESARSILFGSSSSDRRIARGVDSLAGLTIEGISLVGRLPELCVKLSGGLWIASYSASETQPDWSIFLSDGTWLTIRRGRVVREAATHESTQMKKPNKA